jgi:hypothetical protein
MPAAGERHGKVALVHVQMKWKLLFCFPGPVAMCSV